MFTSSLEAVATILRAKLIVEKNKIKFPFVILVY
jgi:hypothetical protein